MQAQLAIHDTRLNYSSDFTINMVISSKSGNHQTQETVTFKPTNLESLGPKMCKNKVFTSEYADNKARCSIVPSSRKKYAHHESVAKSVNCLMLSKNFPFGTILSEVY